MSNQLEDGDSSESQPTTGRSSAEAISTVRAAASVDLAAEIASQIAREPAERVSCRRIAGNYYRCNWWARGDASHYDNPHMSGLTVTTHIVRKSAFLRAVKSRDGLAIDVIEGRVIEDDDRRR